MRGILSFFLHNITKTLTKYPIFLIYNTFGFNDKISSCGTLFKCARAMSANWQTD